jgi:periplasmic divalent cation tolerance protein
MESAKNPSQQIKTEKFIVVLVTVGSEEEGTRLGRLLVENGLVACANILPMKKSIYKWEGKIIEEPECLVLLKSRRNLFEQLSTTIKQLHTYQMPEIVAIPIEEGSQDYLNWVMENTHN